MSRYSRRDLLRRGSLGLAALGVSGLVLHVNARPTLASGGLGAYQDVLKKEDLPVVQAPAKLAVTEDNILGPYHRPGAPFRAKITPPRVPGRVLVISGRVWGFDTRKPLVNAVLDI